MYDYMYIYKILKLTLLYDIQPERKMKKQSQIFVTVVALLICHNVMVSQKRCYTYDAAGSEFYATKAAILLAALLSPIPMIVVPDHYEKL